MFRGTRDHPSIAVALRPSAKWVRDPTSRPTPRSPEGPGSGNSAYVAQPVTGVKAAGPAMLHAVMQGRLDARRRIMQS